MAWLPVDHLEEFGSAASNDPATADPALGLNEVDQERKSRGP